MKRTYTVPETEIVSFATEDILMASGDNEGNDPPSWGDFISGGIDGGEDLQWEGF